VTETDLHKSSPRGLDVSSWCRVRSPPAPPHSRGRGPASPPLPPATSCRPTHCFQGTVTVNLLSHIDFFSQKIRKNHKQFQCGIFPLRIRIQYFFLKIGSGSETFSQHNTLSPQTPLPPSPVSWHAKESKCCENLTRRSKRYILCFLQPDSVADSDPGSGAFLAPGSGMGKKAGSGSGMNNPDHIS
jgi:hypothetical protein